MKDFEINAPLVTISWLYDRIDHPDLIILDATIKKVTSKAGENASNIKIKNSRFFDIKKSFSDKNTDLPNMLPSEKDFEEACRKLGINANHKIVIYDKLGIYSSPRVWWMFKAMGHQQVAVLDGGLPEWQKANLPCEDETNLIEYTSGNFRAVYNPKLVINSEDILSAIHRKDILILDARSPGRFTAQEPEPRDDLKGGHIPNSMNLHYAQVLKDSKMLPIDTLKEILADFNIENKKLIFTCGSGITACIIMLAANLAGYKNVSIYDGSWSEWGQLSGVPIEC
ncbi:sulfurtransferase [Aquimarina gracilis]|uniref:Sulfurtransferase n=1 Tax=Aquimarina gracilis TaxID=874422 RepID=A0ABU6A0R4_9FLAO|nr:sulfurtransferase [Aquimarina gracilis]MEB3347691.1 sulfurtransferase [Aquimarina gracilis]